MTRLSSSVSLNVFIETVAVPPLRSKSLVPGRFSLRSSRQFLANLAVEALAGTGQKRLTAKNAKQSGKERRGSDPEPLITDHWPLLLLCPQESDSWLPGLRRTLSLP